jgi:hypothetical protein
MVLDISVAAARLACWAAANCSVLKDMVISLWEVVEVIELLHCSKMKARENPSFDPH